MARSPDKLLIDLLAEFDEALAHRQTPAPSAATESSEWDDATRARHRRNQACVELLALLRSGLVSAAADTPSGAGAAGATTPLPVHLPERLGRFKIRRELGRGGFGIVYLADDPQLGRQVALKVPRAGAILTSELTAELSQRFLREALAAGKLHHANLVRVLDVAADGPAFYIVSDYCPGPTLARWLRETSRPCPPRLAARWIASLASAVHYMHGEGILHRDIKPSNILLQSGNEKGDRTFDCDPETAIPKLTDFGLAKVLAHADEHTRTGAMLGTPMYMAPEQAEGRSQHIGPATDVYGLGVVLYELLAGQPPFRGENSVAIVQQVVAEDPEAPRRRRRDVPRDLQAICLKCLEKRPQDRYPTANDLWQDLRNFLEGRPTNARPLPLAQLAVKWARRRPAAAGLAATLAAVVIALIGGTSWYAVKTERDNAELAQINDKLAKTAQSEHDQRVLAEEREHELRLSTYAERFDRALEAFQADRVGQAVELLSELRPGANEKDIRGFEWHYLKGLCHPLERVLRGHLTMVRAVAVSPDGKTLASACFAGGDSRIRLWDLETGRVRTTLSVPRGSAVCLMFSPDGRMLAAVCGAEKDSEFIVWDVATPRVLVRNEVGSVSAPAPHPSGAFAPNGKTFAVTTLQGGLEVWDLATATRRAHHPWSAPDQGGYGLAFASDGKTVAVGHHDGVVRFWNVMTGAVRSTLGGHDHRVKALAFAPDGETLASGCEACVRLWEMTASKPLACLPTSHPVCQLAFSSDGRLLAAATSNAETGAVKVWNAATGAHLATFDSLGGEVVSLAFIPRTRHLAVGCQDRTVKIIDLGPAPASKELPGHVGAEAWTLAFSRDGRLLVSGGDDHQVRVIDMITGKQRSLPGAHQSLVTAVAFAQGGGLLASASFDGTVKLWDGATFKPLRTLTSAAGERLRSVALAPDSSVVAAGARTTDAAAVVRLWDAATGRELPPLVGHARTVRCVAFTPDGATLVSGSEDGSVRWWSTSDWRLLAETSVAEQVSALAFAPDGCTLATADIAGDIQLWDAAKRTRKTTLRGHVGEVLALAYTPDGRTLCSSGADKTVRLWQAATGRQLMVLEGHATRVNAVAFTPDGRTLASAGHDGAIKLWAGGGNGAGGRGR